MRHRLRSTLIKVVTIAYLWVYIFAVCPASSLLAKPVNIAHVPAQGSETSLAPWALALIGLGGFIFMIAAVYLGLRWLQTQTGSDSDESPKPTMVKAPGIAALQVGETLTYGRAYVIEALLTQTSDMNVYQGRCVETQQSVMIKECRDVRVYGMTPTLFEMHLSHPNILVAETLFTINTGDEGAFVYQVVPDYRAYLQTQIKHPLPIDAVIAIGEGLARGLAYLHEHHVQLLHLTHQHIVITGDRAQLLALENVVLMSTNSNEQAQAQDNVRLLAGILYQLATGKAIDNTVESQSLDGVLWQLVRMASVSSSLSAVGCAEKLRSLRLAGSSTHVCAAGIGSHTDVGRVREVNEDSLLVLDDRVEGICDALVLVADGVGGHQAGDVASRITVETIRDQYNKLVRGVARVDPADGLGTMAITANEQVYNARVQNESNMGSTLVMAWCRQNQAMILNVGDSRAYRLNPYTMAQLSVDHSLVERLIAIGQITREEARMHPRRSVIYRMIGERDQLEFDTFHESFLPGEALLLCSDGLSDLLTDQQIWQIWRVAPSSEAACQALVGAANSAGGYDNITVVIVQFSDALLDN